HGSGMDRGAEWCRAQGVERLVHIEPDCLILGPRWLEELLRGLDQGYWLVGSERKAYGPIHPTPSAWWVPAITTSFTSQSRDEDAKHPRYAELFDEGQLESRVTPAEWKRYWGHCWDTAQRAWFLAAVADKAKLLPPA